MTLEIDSDQTTVLVTGGLGFIGSAVVRHLMQSTQVNVCVLDAMTYAAIPEAVGSYAQSDRYTFIHGDIRDAALLKRVVAESRPTIVMHLAAESHVDRSIDGPDLFVRTNVLGTVNVLQACRSYFEGLHGAARDAFRMHHISTDEVFGSLSLTDPAFTETTPYDPRSPYSASKAASDHFVRAWGETFGLPVVISNCSNNYGPWQFPEKLIPVMISKGCDRQPLPVYGKGENVRDWLHVEDHAEALWLVASRGKLGESYNIGGNSERSNIQVVQAICASLDRHFPDRPAHDQLITYVTDRPGHDFRYAIDAHLIHKELGWQPRHNFEDGLRETVDWYLDNEEWWRAILDRTDGAKRLGLANSKT